MGHTALREDVRQAILEATDRLIRRYGYKKTTVEDIAGEAGISRGTVYLYFKCKEEIALSWAARNHRCLCGALHSIALRNASPTVRLREMLLERVLFRFDMAQHYTQSIDDLLAALRPALLVLRERNQEAEAQVFAEVLQEGETLGEFAFQDALTSAGLLILATDALSPYSLSARQLGKRDEIEAKARGLIDLLLNGLHRRQKPSRLDRHAIP
jgi:AcrR family transcriptional regulator